MINKPELLPVPYELESVIDVLKEAYDETHDVPMTLKFLSLQNSIQLFN